MFLCGIENIIKDSVACKNVENQNEVLSFSME
jgi:hypothetical protein